MNSNRQTTIGFTAIVIVFISCVSAVCSINFFEPQISSINPNDLAQLRYYTEQYPPYNYIENGQIKGVSVELLSAITQKLGAQATPRQINLTAWTDGYQEALTQNNTVLFSTVRLPERENLFKWAGPICTYQYALFAGWDTTTAVNNTVELKNYRIGVITDDAAIPLLLAAGVDRSHLVNETSAEVLIEKLAHGTIDLWCYPEEVGRHITKEETGNYYAFNVVYRLKQVDLYYAFSIGTPDSTVNAFQAAINELKNEKDNRGFSTHDMILGQYIPAIGFAHLNYLTEEYTPFNYQGEHGEATGISVEILQSIFSRSGVKAAPNVKVVPLVEGFQQAQQDSSTCLFSIVRTPEREPNYNWVGPFSKVTFVVYSEVDSNLSIASVEDLNMYRIGTVNHTIEYDLLVGQGVDSSNIVLASTPAELLQMLQNDQIDVWAVGELTGHYEINSAGLDTKQFEQLYTIGEKEVYFIFSRNVPNLLIDAFQHAIEAVRNQKDAQGFSEYERIIYRNLGVGYAKQTFSNSQVVALVEQTADAIRQNATDAFLHINAGESPYKSTQYTSLYVFAYDTNATMVAHADNILLVGVNFHGKTDVAGTPFRDYIIQGALSNGKGWVDYVYSNIGQTNLYYKTTYYQLVTGSDGVQYVVCSGNFKN